MGRKIRKAIGALFVAVAIAVTQIPVSDVEAENTASASDFQIDGTTLVKYNGTAQDVSVSNDVKKIESGAFAGNEYIKSVRVGNSVVSIGSGAFKDCPNLESVTIPDSVETIEQAVFADCPRLSNVRIGEGLKILGNGVFAGDECLETVAVSGSNPCFTCKDGAIYSKGGDVLYAVLSGRRNPDYVMPSTVSKISPYAFWGDKNLRGVAVSGNVKEISAYAFSNCCNLQTVEIPYSVNAIGLKAFEDCVRLRSISIPISVNTIHSTAFDGCTRLTIEAEPGSTARRFADQLVLEDIDVAEYEDTSIDTIGTAQDGNEGATGESGETAETAGSADYYHEVTHINPLETEEDESVMGKSRVVGNEVIVFMDNASATVNSGNAITSKQFEGVVTGETGETIAAISGNRNEKGGTFPKYAVVKDTIIANQAYYNDSRSAITIPDTITEIGDFAFARSGLTEAVIPEGVRKIGYAAFYHCNNLTNVIIPDTVEEIAPSAFAGTPWFTDWVQNGNGDFLIVGDGILLGYRGGNSIVAIPEGIKTIGADAFAGHSGITKIILPDSVEVIGEGAFADCGNLTDIEGGSFVRQIRDRAYQGCPLQMIRIPASVEAIGLRAFDVADSVKAAGNGVVIFDGDSLPEISCEPSSGKLYNEEHRGFAFDGIGLAVVRNSEMPLDGTVLDRKLSGFKGIVCTVDEKTEKTENEQAQSDQTETEQTESGQGDSRSLKIRQIRTEGMPLSSYPDTVTAGNAVYEVDKVNLPKERELIDMEADTGETDLAQTGVTVRISSRSIEDNGTATAVLDGSENNYLLKIVDSEAALDAVLEACREVYGRQMPKNLLAYEITLQEADTSIPITGLGRQEIEISIPLPDGIVQENLHVVCLDANGQLEETTSRVVSVNGTDCIVFRTNHFSPYAIYNYLSGNTAVVSNGQAVFSNLSARKDISPDTGDNSIHPKYFLGIGLLFTGISLFFYRGKHRKAR